MGRAMKNLDKLLAMPYGCGEQNMVLFAPNIFILNYLKSTGQLTQEIQDRATRFLESGELFCEIMVKVETFTQKCKFSHYLLASMTMESWVTFLHLWSFSAKL